MAGIMKNGGGQRPSAAKGSTPKLKDSANLGSFTTQKGGLVGPNNAIATMSPVRGGIAKLLKKTSRGDDPGYPSQVGQINNRVLKTYGRQHFLIGGDEK